LIVFSYEEIKKYPGLLDIILGENVEGGEEDLCRNL